jgi:predicted cupin superfamily sugar epimerase
MVDGLSFFHPHLHHEVFEVFSAEQAHKVVVQGDKKSAAPGITLASGTAPELVVDAPALVALRAQNVEPPGGAHLLVVPAPGFVLLGYGLAEGLFGSLAARAAPGPELRIAAQLMSVPRRPCSWLW